jgi:hypothetical protein
MPRTTRHQLAWGPPLGVLLAALILCALAGTAYADVSRKKAIWGPVRVDGVSQFPTYRSLGAGIYMTRVNWNEVAASRPEKALDPADPAYAWPAELDDAVQQARRHGIRVAVTVTGAPAWASGKSDPIWAPRKARDFARFVAAASKRYPSVRLWQIWAEPTQTANFQPLIHENRDPEQDPSIVRPLTREMKRGPHRYARILDAAYAALKKVNRRNLVIGGNTFTTGDVSVLNWIRNLRLANGRPPRMDLYGHNPFSARRPVFGGPPLGYGFADFTDLPILARWIDRHLGRRRSNRGAKIFISELLWPTDHSNFEFNFWVSQETAASWLTDALRETRKWKRIYTLAWLALYDDPPREDGLEVNRGLLTRDGQKKPAYRAYKRG